MDPLDLSQLLESWTLHLRAERKSAQTIKTYGDGVRALLRWADRTGKPPLLDRPTVRAFIADLLEDGAEPATARSRQLAVRRFSAWLAEEGEIPSDDLITLKPPKLDEKIVPELDEDELRRLIKACSTGPTQFLERRDEAVVRLMVECGARAGEVVAMTMDDLDLREGLVTVRRGKGGRARRSAIGPQTVRSIDRYLRVRRGHRLADTPALWLGDRGKSLTYWGLHDALNARGEQAGLVGFHPHVLRHTGAGRWLAAGGSEGGLMATFGWTRRDMLDRYTKATSERRAADEARRLNLGDL